MTQASAPPNIFSSARKQRAAFRRTRLQSFPDAPRYILDDMIEDVLDRLSFLRHAPETAVIIGDWTGGLSAALLAQGTTVADIPHMNDEAPLDDRHDLVVSLCRLDRVNDLPGALIHLRNALADGGLMIASFPGAGSLPTLRKAMTRADGDRPAARFHPMVDVRAGGQLLQRAGFAQPVIDTRTLQARFGSMDRLVGDLRAQGLGSVLADPAMPLSKSAVDTARAAFLEDADADGRVTEIFEILTLSGWRR